MYGSSVNFGGLSQQAFKTTHNPIFDRLAQQNQAYQDQLATRSNQIKNLESMYATSPSYQLKKYIWQSNEAMMPQPNLQQQPVYSPQVTAQQPAQAQPATPQITAQQQQIPEWLQYSQYSAPMNYYQQPSYYQQQPLNYGYGQQYLW
jgi:hypothetical protein